MEFWSDAPARSWKTESQPGSMKAPKSKYWLAVPDDPDHDWDDDLYDNVAASWTDPSSGQFMPG